MSQQFYGSDSNMVETAYQNFPQYPNTLITFESVDVLGLQQVKKSLSAEPQVLWRMGYSLLPATDIFKQKMAQPFNLHMEGRRFVDMLQQPQFGGTMKTLQLCRALLEELYAVEVQRKQNSSKQDCITVQNVLFIVNKFQSLITGFYNLIPQYLNHVLDYTIKGASHFSSAAKAQAQLGNYYRILVREAEDKISTLVANMIEPNDTILVIACSHLLLNALTKKANEFSRENMKFSVIFTQMTDATAGQKLQQLGIRVVQQKFNHLNYVLKDCKKAFSGCFEISANGDVLCRAGALQVAILLSNRQIPLYFAAEQFKFCNKALISQFRQNAAFQSEKIEFAYDVVNHSLITGIVCERGCFGCDSLRILPCCQGGGDAEKGTPSNEGMGICNMSFIEKQESELDDVSNIIGTQTNQ